MNVPLGSAIKCYCNTVCTDGALHVLAALQESFLGATVRSVPESGARAGECLLTSEIEIVPESSIFGGL